MPEVRFSEPRPFRGQEHIAFHASCSVNGMSTWGYRIECKGCGETSECTVGSSVSYEDAPRAFAWKHRDCAEAFRTGQEMDDRAPASDVVMGRWSNDA